MDEIRTMTKPAWVHRCIRRYVRRGMSQEEAEQRCYGAAHGKAFKSTVFRGADGKRYMALVASNGYCDREREWVTTRALKRYVDEAYAGDGFQAQPLYFWHDEAHGLDHPIGEIIHAEMIGPFLFEIAKEREDDAYSQAHWNYLETTDEPQGASIGFRFVAREFRDREYRSIEKFETSTLPLAMAANPLTFSGVIKMDENERDEELKKRGLLDHVRAWRDSLTTAKRALDAAGVEHKAVADDAKPAEESEEPEPAAEGEEDEDLDAEANALAEIMAKYFQEVPENFADIVKAALAELYAASEPQMAEGSGVPVEEDDATKEKRAELYDWLMDTQAEIVKAQDETASVVKQIADVLGAIKEVPASVEELAAQVEGLTAEIETVQKALNMRPRLATRELPVTETDMNRLSELVQAEILKARGDAKNGGSDRFWGGADNS